MAERPQLGPTAQKVLELLRANPGTAFAPDDVCEQVDCSGPQARMSLESLANAGLIQREDHVGGAVTYVAR